jgi:transposase
MPAALSDDLRLRIHEARAAGETAAAVADRFAVSERTVYRLGRRYREAATLAPRPGGTGPAATLAPHMAALAAATAQRPGDTPAEHRDRLGLPASRRTVARAMARLGLTRKKSPSGRPSGTART